MVFHFFIRLDARLNNKLCRICIARPQLRVKLVLYALNYINMYMLNAIAKTLILSISKFVILTDSISESASVNIDKAGGLFLDHLCLSALKAHIQDVVHERKSGMSLFAVCSETHQIWISLRGR